MIANLCRVMKEVEGVIFVDAGLSERQMDLCERLMGLNDSTKSFQGQLDLQILLNKHMKTIHVKDAKIQVKNRLRRGRGYLAIVDNQTKFIKKVFFDRKPIFVCNDAKYPPIFNQINFIDDLDRWVYLIANAATRGKSIAVAFSSTADQRVVVNKIKAQISDEIAVTSLNSMGCRKTRARLHDQDWKAVSHLPLHSKVGGRLLHR